MMTEPIKRRDVFKPWLVFRSSITRQYVSRMFALMHPHHTVKERRS